jgi:hypothetical protein
LPGCKLSADVGCIPFSSARETRRDVHDNGNYRF